MLFSLQLSRLALVQDSTYAPGTDALEPSCLYSLLPDPPLLTRVVFFCFTSVELGSLQSQDGIYAAWNDALEPSCLHSPIPHPPPLLTSPLSLQLGSVCFTPKIVSTHPGTHSCALLSRHSLVALGHYSFPSCVFQNRSSVGLTDGGLVFVVSSS